MSNNVVDLDDKEVVLRYCRTHGCGSEESVNRKVAELITFVPASYVKENSLTDDYAIAACAVRTMTGEV